MAVLGQSACQPNRIYGPLPQTSFLGCSVISFVMTHGWNEQSSELTVELVQDPCPSNRVWWDSNLNRQFGVRSDPGFKYPEPGSPVYFRIETNPEASNPLDRGGFEYSGLVSSWTEKRDSGGNPIFTVRISDPRDVLGNSQIILNDYTGSIYNVYNLINVQGFVESFGETCSSSLSGGLSNFVSERGVLWENIKCALQTLTSTIDRANIPPVYQEYCRRNRLVYIAPRNTNTNTPDFGDGLFPADANLNNDLNLSGIPNANLNICEYLLDLTEIPLSPDHYRISGPNISLLELISQVCQDSGSDYYIELLPIKDNLGNIFKIIKVRVAIRNSQPPMGAIQQFINLKSNTEQTFMAGTVGEELRPEPTSVFLMGGNLRYPYLTNSECSAKKCVWSLDETTNPPSYVLISDNCPDCCECQGVPQNIIDDLLANDPFLPPPKQTIFTSCQPNQLPLCDRSFYPYFGKDKQGKLHQISYQLVSLTGLVPNNDGDAWIPGPVRLAPELIVSVDVTDLNQTLKIPIVDDFDRPFARISDSELRGALDNIDSWKMIADFKNLEIGKYLKAIGLDLSGVKANISGLIRGPTDESPISIGLHSIRVTEIDDELEDLVSKVYNFVKDFANTYYGKQFLIQVDGICEAQDPETNEFRYSHNTSPEGCWINDNVSEIDELHLVHNTSDSDFFRDDQGKYQPILLFPNLGKSINGDYPYFIDLDQLSKDDYISSLDEIHSTGTGISTTGITWVRATVDPEWIRGTPLGPCRDSKCNWQYTEGQFVLLNSDCPDCCSCTNPTQPEENPYQEGDTLETPCIACDSEGCQWTWNSSISQWIKTNDLCPSCCSCPPPFFNGSENGQTSTTQCSPCGDQLCEWSWNPNNSEWVLSQFNCADCCQSPPMFSGEEGMVVKLKSTCDPIGDEICALLKINSPIFSFSKRSDNIQGNSLVALAGMRNLFKALGQDLDENSEYKIESNSRSDIIIPFAPEILMPSGALVPLVDNTQTYGPWGSGGLPGSVMFESDEGFVPWEYSSDRIMNIAAFEKVSNSVTQFRKTERGSVQLAGFPELPLGSEIMSLDSLSPPISVTTQKFLETRTFSEQSCTSQIGLQLNSYIIPMGAWTGQYGPSITQINVSIGPQGFTTDYQFSTYTPQFGRFNRSNAERLKKNGQQRLNTKREANANKRLLAIQSSQVGASRDYRNSKMGTSLQPATSHDLLIGMYTQSNFPLSERTGDYLNNKKNSLVHSDAVKYFTNAITNTGVYKKTSFMSWDGLIRPVSKTGSGGLPRYPSGIPTGFPNRKDLDPFQSGHDILSIAFGDNFTPDGMINLAQNSGHESGNIEDYRFMALRGPLVIGGWGYDTNGYPIPNVQDSGAPSGVFRTSVESGDFYSGYLSNANTWPVAPVDMRFDRERHVWVAGGGEAGCNEVVFQVDCVSGTSAGEFDDLVVSGRILGVPCGCTEIPGSVTDSEGICRIRVHDILHCLWREDSSQTLQTWLGRRGFAHYIQPFNPQGCQPKDEPCIWAIHSLCCPNQASTEPGIFKRGDILPPLTIG